MSRWLFLIALMSFGLMGCNDDIHLIQAEFEIDSAESIDFRTSYTKDEIDDLNLTVVMDPNYIVIPTGLAVAFTAKGFYVRVAHEDRDEFASATVHERFVNYDATDPPADETLTMASVGDDVMGVQVVNNQNESDTRARWVIWGISEGESALVIEGTESEGGVQVPVSVIFQ